MLSIYCAMGTHALHISLQCIVYFHRIALKLTLSWDGWSVNSSKVCTSHDWCSSHAVGVKNRVDDDIDFLQSLTK